MFYRSFLIWIFIIRWPPIHPLQRSFTSAAQRLGIITERTQIWWTENRTQFLYVVDYRSGNAFPNREYLKGEVAGIEITVND